MDWIDSDTICNNAGPHPNRLVGRYYFDSLALYYLRSFQHNQYESKDMLARVLTRIHLSMIRLTTLAMDDLKL